MQASVEDRRVEGRLVSDDVAGDLAARMDALDPKLDAVLSGLASLHVGGLDTLTMAEVCTVLRLRQTKVNELAQAGELGMSNLGVSGVTRGTGWTRLSGDGKGDEGADGVEGAWEAAEGAP